MSNASAYGGDGSERVDLAGLTVLGLINASVVSDWLVNGVAVLELHTARGIVLVTGIGPAGGTSQPELVFHRLSDLEQNSRSDLKIDDFEIRQPSKCEFDVIEACLIESSPFLVLPPQSQEGSPPFPWHGV